MPLTLAADTITFTDQTTLSPSTVKWNIISTITNLNSNNKYLTDTTNTGFTVTLPTAPLNGDFIVLTDGYGTWENNNLIIDRNGKNINGAAENLICDLNFGKIELIYQSAANSWRTSIF